MTELSEEFRAAMRRLEATEEGTPEADAAADAAIDALRDVLGIDANTLPQPFLFRAPVDPLVESSTMTVEMAKALREPFPAEMVGLLPRITCPDCSKARGKVCDQHQKSKCSECQAYITSRHIHLDYVGHGAVTDRLLSVDPTWNWEPLRFDPTSGMPTMVYDTDGNPVSFWIRLTVGGVTRLGVGTCESGQFDAEKVLIGDAIRNAAMRFGVALDLWIRGHAEDDEVAAASSDRQANRGAPPDQRQQERQQAKPKPDPDAADFEATEALKAQVKAMPPETRARLVELWIEPEGDSGKPLLPTTEKDGRQVPVFGKLRRVEVPVAEALIAKAIRETVGQVDDLTVRETTPASAPAASGPMSMPEDDKPEPETGEEPADATQTGEVNWAAEGAGLGQVLATAKLELPHEDADKITSEVWNLHHAKLNKALDEVGDPARPGEPIDVRRMRLAIVRIEEEIDLRRIANDLRAEATERAEDRAAEATATGEEPF